MGETGRVFDLSMWGGEEAMGGAAAGPGSGATSDGGDSTRFPTRVIAMIAALALVSGVGLLTVRRWAPGLWTRS